MGRGPAPKDPERRARRNADPVPGRVLQLHRAGARELPDDLLREGETWHPSTQRWWAAWRNSVLSNDWTETEWAELEVAAKLHHRFMRETNTNVAGELRQRMAKLGATSEDRARLRIVLADADEREDRANRPKTGAAARYEGLRTLMAVDNGTKDEGADVG